MRILKSLQEEMLDRFGEYPDEVACLFQIAEMKVYALLNGVEQIKQTKQEVTILCLNRLPTRLMEVRFSILAVSLAEMLTPGMEGPRLKIVIKVKEYKTSQWLNIAFEMVKGLAKQKRVMKTQ